MLPFRKESESFLLLQFHHPWLQRVPVSAFRIPSSAFDDRSVFHCALAHVTSQCQKTRVHDGSITIRIAANISEIERLNRLVRQFGELHEVQGRALYAMNLAVDELVTNAVLYGFDKEPGNEQIVVEIAGRGDELRATISDTGREFDPRTIPPPNLDAPIEERALGGLGIHLVRSLMDSVDYRRAGEKNVLTVTKRIR